MIVPLHKGRIKNQQVHLDNRDRFDQYIASQPDGTEIVLLVAPAFKIPTWEQFKYYWEVVLGTISDYTGHSREGIHSLLLHRFYGYVEGDGTSQMSRQELSNHIDRVCQWSFDFLDLVIPPPKTVWIGRHRQLV